MDCQAPGLRQARAQRQGFAWRVYVHQWSRVTERNCLVCLACLCLASLRQDLAVMPGAGFDFRRRGQCGDVCWDACGLSASGVWTTRACFMSSNAVVAFHGLQIVPQGNARNQDVAKPTGLFAFLLYMCCMALWSLRMKSFRRKWLQRNNICISVVLLLPCMYGLALSLWNFNCVWMLGVSVSYAASKRIATHHRCDRGGAVEPPCAGLRVRKPKPWNISCIKGRKDKK